MSKKLKNRIEETAVKLDDCTEIEYKCRTYRWSREWEGYIFDELYDFEKFEPLLKEHFRGGGAATYAVLAGLCEVSVATVRLWRDRDGDACGSRYKPEFDALIQRYENVAIAELDRWHREAACGVRPDVNAQVLNRRAEKMLSMVPQQKVVAEFTSVAQCDEELARIKRELANYAVDDE